MKWKNLGLIGASLALAASASREIIQDVETHFRPALGKSLRDKVPQPAAIRNATTMNLFSRFFHQFDARQTEGRCGQSGGGAKCPNNQCCSTFDYCGTDSEHCSTLVGCQPQYGRCGDAAPEPTTTPTPTPSPTPTPTPSTSSSSVIVTSSSSVVLPPSSTLPVPSSLTVLPPLPSGTLVVSPNGQCGNVTTCGGSPFGNCCSEWYFCGSGASYCGTGCRSAFGTCNGGSLPISSSSVSLPVLSSSSVLVPISSSSTVTVPISSTSSRLTSSSAPSPTPTPTPTPSPSPSPSPSSTAPAVPTNVSTTGRCGVEGNGMTCLGSTFGRCCSDYGWCGSQDDYCRISYGCQPAFGTCG